MLIMFTNEVYLIYLKESINGVSKIMNTYIFDDIAGSII
jgi:hypothetical protein